MERNLYFKCVCGKVLAIDEAGVGRTVKCTDCGQPIQVPRPEIEFDCACGLPIILPANMAGETIQCVGCKKSYKVPEPEQTEETPKQKPVPAVKVQKPLIVSPQPSTARAVHVLRPNDKPNAPANFTKPAAVLRQNDRPKSPSNFSAQSSPKGFSSRKCPSCGCAITQDAVLCINCGLDFRTGKKRKSAYDEGKTGDQQKSVLQKIGQFAHKIWMDYTGSSRRSVAILPVVSTQLGVKNIADTCHSASSGANIQCPFCGENISSTVLKCKHCGEFVAYLGTSAGAILSLIFGCFGLSILAIIIGHLSRRKIFALKGNLKGEGIALAGIVLGYIGLAITVVLLLSIAIPSFNKARASSQMNACVNNMRQIEIAKDQWALGESKTNGTPVDISVLINSNNVNSGYLKDYPKCPVGGKYECNEIGKNCQCSIHGTLD